MAVVFFQWCSYFAAQSYFYPTDIVAIQYCQPQGDRIATAIRDSVQVWDSNNGRLHSSLVSSGTTTTSVSYPAVQSRNWDQPPGHQSQNGQSPVATPNRALPFQSMGNSSHILQTIPSHFGTASTHAQLGLIQHPQVIYSIAFSPDDRFLAIGDSGKITIRNL
jgi:WD40 repeat protein